MEKVRCRYSIVGLRIVLRSARSCSCVYNHVSSRVYVVYCCNGLMAFPRTGNSFLHSVAVGSDIGPCSMVVENITMMVYGWVCARRAARTRGARTICVIFSYPNRYQTNGYQTVPPYSKDPDPIPRPHHRKSKCGKNNNLAKGL